MSRSLYWTLNADDLFRLWHEKRRATDILYRQALRPLLLGDIVRDMQRMDRIIRAKKRKGSK
jgi:hypothetical protein